MAILKEHGKSRLDRLYKATQGTPGTALERPWKPLASSFNDLQIQLDKDSDNNNTQKKRQCKSQE